MNYFYVLRSEKDSWYYYVPTSDLKKRVQQYQNSKVTAAKHRLPLKLVYYEAYLSLDIARYRERQVKSSGSVHQSILKRISMGV